MLKLLGDLKTYLKFQEVVNASFVFRLHNSFTAAALMACSLVITATQYVGTPIQCINDGPKDFVKPITTFCWITSTFTIPFAHDRPRIGVDAAHPGVTNGGGQEERYHTYYQWVCFALFFQAVFCYLPKLIWDAWEGKLLFTLVNNARVGVYCEGEKEKKKNVVVRYMLDHVESHNFYAFRYWFCEFLCLVNIIAQLNFMNVFFQGEFLKYGLKVFTLSEMDVEHRSDALSYLFPKVTKCTFRKYGPSGSLQIIDSMCILPLNIVNEKTYIFIWFWFMVLLSLLTLLILFRILIICCPFIRPRLLRARNRMVPYEVAAAICRKVKIGDWWLLYMLGSNMDPIIYRDFIMELVKKIETHTSNL